MPSTLSLELAIGILDTLPNPVLVKDAETRYVWINHAFETLFGVRRDALVGRLDKDVFRDRQAVQCNGGDLRVLDSGTIDEAYETVFAPDGSPRETITRKSRLTLESGTVYLVGVMHDITNISGVNRALESSKTLLEQQSEALVRLVNSDPLTGCLNRRALFDRAPAAFARHRSGGALLMLDIDHFKNINDTHGHAIGDAALVHFSELVKEAMRANDELARLGGEEFAVLLPGAGVVEAREIAERIRARVEARPLRVDGVVISMTVSVGLALELDRRPLDLDDALRRADDSLYAAKRAGRNRVCVADRTRQTTASTR